jgi:hypothetical protein
MYINQLECRTLVDGGSKRGLQSEKANKKQSKSSKERRHGGNEGQKEDRKGFKF